MAKTVKRRIKLDPCCIVPEILIEADVPADTDAEDYIDAMLSLLIRDDVWCNCVWDFAD